MTSKLTLTVDKTIIDTAKSYASANKISLSKVVEFYLTSLFSKSRTGSFKLPPITRSLIGIAGDSNKAVNDKTDLKKALVERHL